MLHRKFFINNFFKATRSIVLAFFICTLALTGCKTDGQPVPISNENPNAALVRATVIKVKDGDSLVLRYANGVEKEARLFGIDAPDYRYL